MYVTDDLNILDRVSHLLSFAHVFYFPPSGLLSSVSRFNFDILSSIISSF